MLASRAIPVGGTAGAIETIFGSTFEQLGAIGGGEAIAPHEIRLRFASTAEALIARAAIANVVDGVRILVTAQQGGHPYGTAPTADAVAALLAQVDGVTKAEVRHAGGRAVFVVTSDAPDVNAHLDTILRDDVRGLPVVWQTGDAAAPSA